MLGSLDDNRLDEVAGDRAASCRIGGDLLNVDCGQAAISFSFPGRTIIVTPSKRRYCAGIVACSASRRSLRSPSSSSEPRCDQHRSAHVAQEGCLLALGAERSRWRICRLFRATVIQSPRRGSRTSVPAARPPARRSRVLRPCTPRIVPGRATAASSSSPAGGGPVRRERRELHGERRLGGLDYSDGGLTPSSVTRCDKAARSRMPWCRGL